MYLCVYVYICVNVCMYVCINVNVYVYVCMGRSCQREDDRGEGGGGSVAGV